MTMTMHLRLGGKKTADDLKAFVALAATGLKVAGIEVDAKYVNCSPQLVVDEGEGKERVLMAANAICLYLAATTSLLQYDDLAVDDWLAWENLVLAPWVREARSATGDKAALAHELDALLETKEQARAKSDALTFLFGNELTLADIVAGVALRGALALVPVEHDTELLAKFRAYVAQVFQQAAFVEGEALNANDGKIESKLDVEALAGETSHNLLALVESIFVEAIHKAYPDVALANIDITRTNAKNAKIGDYQCNSAMAIFTALKGTPNAPRTPRDVANAIIKVIPENALLERYSVAGAGFINAFVTPAFAKKRLSNVLRKGVFPSPVKKARIAVDFSSPNIAKDMHVGHLRSTIIGDTMCRILEFQGHDVLRINHVGDWGTQFGMLICHLTETYPQWETEMPDVTDLTKLYKAAKERFDSDEAFHARSKQQVVELQSGNEQSRKVWKTLCAISRKEFQKVYDRLGVVLEETGESFYNPIIPGVIDKLKAKGLTEVSNGALVIFTEKFKQPFILVKSDGSYLYDTTDIAALWYRLHELKADRLIYYTDYTQNDHFGLLFEVARKAGFVDPAKNRCDHVGFGTVNDESGKRFKTRSGEVVRLVELLDESKNRMKEQLLARIEAGQTTLPRDQVDYAAERIGYGAVKYFDLRQSPTSSYVFSFDRMLSTNGDTAVYLMFAYARLSSIIRKAGVDMAPLLERAEAVLKPEQPTELALVLELLQLQDVILFVDRDLNSNRLCSYLYTLSEKVQTFVTSCRVIGSEEQDSRLLLCQAALQVMHKCFSLLGIEPLDQI